MSSLSQLLSYTISMTVDTFEFLNYFFYSPAQASSYEAARFDLVQETQELSLGSAPHIGQDDLRSSGTLASSLAGTAYLQNGPGFFNFEY